MNGIVSCGTGVGLMVFPLFLSYVLELMGLIGTFYILAGVALQLMICGAAIIPAEKLMRRKLIKDRKEGDKGLKSIGSLGIRHLVLGRILSAKHWLLIVSLHHLLNLIISQVLLFSLNTPIKPQMTELLNNTLIITKQ